jgi:hypothetical protein
MKKCILGGTIVLAIAAIVVVNLNLDAKSNDLSAIALANVEALAQESGGHSNSWDCWSSSKSGTGVWICGNPCTWRDGLTGKGGASKCYSN